MLSTLFASAMGFFVASFMKSQSGYGSFSTLLGTLIGFVNGVYFEIAAMGEGVQLIVKLIPTFHMAALLRGVLMKKPVLLTFHGASQAEIDRFYTQFGVVFQLFGKTISPVESVLFILVVSIMLFGFAVIKTSKRAEENSAV